jgi:hypothetical protein
LAVIVLRRIGQGDTESARFLLATGALAALAAIDDAYLIHEDIAPSELGLSENVMLAAWFVLSGAWAFRFRSFLLGTERLLIGLAAGSFLASIAIDLITDSYSAVPYEDSFKLIGIATFAAYCWLEAIAGVTSDRAQL